MAIQVYWEDDSKTIVRYDFEGTWTWDDLYKVFYQALAMETSVSHRVDVILDMRQSGRIPHNALTHIKNISDKEPPNIGLSVFVTSNRFLISLYNVGIKFYNKIGYYFRLTSTIEEAHALIAQDRELQRQPSLK
jgi:hypothetical protein